MIICDTHIWTEIDLESYVRNYYVHRQVRAVALGDTVDGNWFLGDAYQSRPDLKFSNI